MAPTSPKAIGRIAFLRRAANVRRLRRTQEEATMIYELRIYHCVTGRLPALLKRFETTTLELWKRHGIRQAGFWTVLVGRRRQPGFALSARLGIARRARDQMEQVRDRSGMAHQARRKREGWPDRRLDQQHVPAADGVLGGEVTATRCRAASITSSMRCATSTRRPNSTAARLHGRRAQPASLGHPQSRSSSFRVSSSSCWRLRSPKSSAPTASRCCSAASTSRSWRAGRACRC